MSGKASDYSALGLEPGADASAVEQAYKQLIKRYHPDRPGGDAARAAEINQAYYQLRKPAEQPFDTARTVDLAQALYARRVGRREPSLRRRRRSNWWPPLILALCGLAWLQREPLQRLGFELSDRLASTLEPSTANDGGPAMPAKLPELAGPLEAEVIAKAVKRAAQLTRGNARDAAIEESRDCHRTLRLEPTLAKLDQCTAFDDAVLEIRNPDPMLEEGGFGASAVTARQMAAAKLLSSDYTEIEGRLDRIRAQVQQLLGSDVANAPAGSPGGLPAFVSSADRATSH
jgi:hypothetical protein